MFDIELIDFENKYTLGSWLDVFANDLKTLLDGRIIQI